MSRGGCSRPE
eukprot:gene13763-biopygen3729